jgi:ADP-heptose:LPS heptosyltransferase
VDVVIDRAMLLELVRRRYSTVVELRGDWRTLLLPFQTGARCRVDRGSVRIRHWLSRRTPARAHPADGLHEVETNLEVVRPLLGKKLPETPKLEVPTSPEAAASMRRKLEALGVDFGAPIVCIHPGAAWRPRAWRAERFAAVADSIQAHYHAQVAVIGSEAERDIETAMRAASNGAKTFWLFGTLSIEEVAALFGVAQLLIGNDAGLAHVAAAVGLPSVVLFGPQEPARFRPWSDKSVVLHHRIHCCPCRQTVCVHPENPCVNLIEVAEVEARVREILEP